jgi:hypothetical protein
VLLRPSSPGPRGFLLRTVTRLLRPRILSTTRGSATLCPLPAPVHTSAVRFSSPFQRLRRQDRRASLGKAYDLPTCRPATPRFESPDIGPRLFASARPSPPGHLAGFRVEPGSCLPGPPHRPVRAGFPHTVPQVTDSLRRWSALPGLKATGIAPGDGCPAPS